MEKLVLIDGNSLINRAFYAMPMLTTKNGEFINAVYGFLNMYFKMLNDEKPTYCAVAFDLKGPTFRHKMYKEYKGTRKPMPIELRPQIPLLKEILKLMNVAIFEKQGFEADDIIGTLAKSTDCYTIIITGDRDSFQLVDKTTEIHFTKRGLSDTEILNYENFKEKTQINPIEIIDLKALMGDASDNIPGVKGVGEKTAKDLIIKYKSIENLYNNLDKVQGKLKEKLEADKEMCFLSKTLATIDVNCEIDKNIEKMKANFIFSSKLKQKFIDLEFKSLYNREELFESEKLADENNFSKIKKITDIKELDIKKKKMLTLTYDNSSIDIFDGIVEYNLNFNEGLILSNYSLQEVSILVKNIVESDIELILYSKKDFKHHFAEIFSKDVKCKMEDVSIIKYLVDFTGGKDNLNDVIQENGMDVNFPAYSLFKIYNNLKIKLKDENIEDLYQKIELPLSDVLYDMECQGFRVDKNAINKLGNEYLLTLSELENKIKSLAGEENLNINSPKQLGEILFVKLKLGKGKKTKTGYSTSSDILESLKNSHEIIPLIIKYRKIQKIYSTYIEGIKPLIEEKTGLVKTSFNQTVTSTGRLSSKEPNLQNIPSREEEGKQLRKFFVPRDSEHILVSADYSQIELRLMASFSNCKNLIAAFLEKKDVHAETASKVFNVKLQNVTDEMRRTAKAVNFGIIYGISEYGLSKNLNISVSEAKSYIDSYFKLYPEIKEYMNYLVDFAKKNGYAETMFKRRRYIKELSSSSFALRQFGERAAMNMPLQGSSADIIKIAMLNVFNKLNKEKLSSKLILQIHDELIIDTFKSEKEKVSKILVEEMENAVKLKVPLTVSLAMGENWYDAK